MGSDDSSNFAALIGGEGFWGSGTLGTIYPPVLTASDNEGKYDGSPSTTYRILAAHGECKERRNLRDARSHAVPRLEATAPNQVWTWVISKLATYVLGVFLNLYLVFDLSGRVPVAWTIAERENTVLSRHLFAEAIPRYRAEPGSITVHNDRGPPMTSGAFIDLLARLGVERSVNRPRVSNDNSYSESCFTTVKYQPDYPGRFLDASHARRWFTAFTEWYASRHRHSGLAFLTPADVFFGRVAGLAETGQPALDADYAPHPERFVRLFVRLSPPRLTINPIDPGAPKQTAAGLLSAPTSPQPVANAAPPLPPKAVLPGVIHSGAIVHAIC